MCAAGGISDQVPGPEEERQAATPEEISSASDIILAMVKSAKGLRMYLSNNPTLIKFLEDLNGRMAAHLERFGDFRLEVDPFALRYQGVEVYQNQDPKESIAFRMHSDGIRVLLLSQGLTERELAIFLEIVGIDRPNHDDDDIVTRLWEKGLPHIAYLLEDDFINMEGFAGAGAAIPAQQQAISRIFADLAQNPPPAVPMVPKHLLMLTGEDVNSLRKAKQADALRNPIEDVIAILSAILAGVRDPVLFRDFAGIMVNLTVNMFLSGEIATALKLVRFMDQLQKRSSIEPEQRQLIAESLAGILCDKTVAALRESIDGGESVSHEELRELLLILGLPSLAAICELLGRVEKLKMRKVIIEVLIELGRDRPVAFAPFLADPRWFLVRNVVLVLSLVGTPVAVNMIAGLISHKEFRIRKEVLGFLERSADPKARSYVLRFLRDDSSTLRIRALQILARERHPFAFKPILALTGSEEFRTRDLAEKRAVYEALAELGPEQMIPLFREMLLKRSWFKRSMPKETAICAVAGLLKMHTKAARELLEEARQHGTVEVRVLVAQAVDSAGTGTGAA